MIFQAYCLSPHHLVVLLRFYLITSSWTYFYAISFCLILCLSSPLLQSVRLLASVFFCHLRMRLLQALAQASSLWGDLVPLLRWALVLSLWWGRSVSHYLEPDDGWGCVPDTVSLAWVIPALESVGCWMRPCPNAKMIISMKYQANEESQGLHHQGLCFYSE